MAFEKMILLALSLSFFWRILFYSVLVLWAVPIASVYIIVGFIRSIMNGRDCFYCPDDVFRPLEWINDRIKELDRYIYDR